MEKRIAVTLDQGAIAPRSPASVANRSPFMYGLGILSISILLESFAGYAYFYYVEILGLALTMAAVVKMVYAIWNSLNDPIFGFLSDNTRSRWGRRHAWLVPSMLLSAVSYIVLFSVPRAIQGTTNLFWYMLANLLLFETLTTILVVNYVALFPEYFHGLKQRANASVYYQGGKVIAVLIGLTLTPLVYRAIGFTGMAISYAILSVGLLALALFANREDPQMRTADKVQFLAAFQNVLKDRLFWKFGITITLVLFGVNIIPFALPFYVRHALGAGPELTAVLSGAALITSLVALPVWGKLVGKWKMKTTFASVILIMSLGTVMLSLPASRWTAIPGIMVIGIAWAGVWVCNNIIRADLVSRNLAKSEKHTEALYYGLLNVIQNAGGILESAAMMLASFLFGYVSGENPGPQPEMAFRFLMGFAPFLMLVPACFFARSFFGDYSRQAATDP